MNKPLANEVLEVIAEVPEVGPESSDVTVSDLLSRVEAQTGNPAIDPARAVQSGVVIGTCQGRNDAGDPLVDFPSNPAGAAVVARSAVPLGVEDIGRAIVLVFDGGDLGRPIVLGLVQPSQPAASQAGTSKAMDVRVDGERVTIEAEKEVVIKCGEASITLTRAGKILIRGTYLLSRSSGANRIKGASVEVN